MTRFDERTGVAATLGLAALVATSVALGSAEVRAQGAGDELAVAVERKDSEIRKDVADQVLRYAYYTVFDSIEAGVENVNSRPRAVDLTATCLSLIRTGVQPDPTLSTRLRQVCDGLGHPW